MDRWSEPSSDSLIVIVGILTRLYDPSMRVCMRFTGRGGVGAMVCEQGIVGYRKQANSRHRSPASGLEVNLK